ncbi:MAG: hypothetical protein E7510_02145 [Ruminococcus sp.]|nr:hypothetical protein [Ruminococcus sp.]
MMIDINTTQGKTSFDAAMVSKGNENTVQLGTEFLDLLCGQITADEGFMTMVSGEKSSEMLMNMCPDTNIAGMFNAYVSSEKSEENINMLLQVSEKEEADADFCKAVSDSGIAAENLVDVVFRDAENIPEVIDDNIINSNVRSIETVSENTFSGVNTVFNKTEIYTQSSQYVQKFSDVSEESNNIEDAGRYVHDENDMNFGISEGKTVSVVETKTEAHADVFEKTVIDSTDSEAKISFNETVTAKTVVSEDEVSVIQNTFQETEPVKTVVSENTIPEIQNTFKETATVVSENSVPEMQSTFKETEPVKTVVSENSVPEIQNTFKEVATVVSENTVSEIQNTFKEVATVETVVSENEVSQIQNTFRETVTVKTVVSENTVSGVQITDLENVTYSTSENTHIPTEYSVSDDTANIESLQNFSIEDDVKNDKFVLKSDEVQTNEKNVNLSEKDQTGSFETLINEAVTLTSLDFAGRSSEYILEDVIAQKDISGQTMEALGAGIKAGKEEFIIKLTPEGLGDITVKFEKTDETVLVKLIASDERTAQLLNQELDVLRTMLKPHNAEIQNVEHKSNDAHDDAFYSGENHGNRFGNESHQNDERPGRTVYQSGRFVEVTDDLDDELQPEMVSILSGNIMLNRYI